MWCYDFLLPPAGRFPVWPFAIKATDGKETANKDDNVNPYQLWHQSNITESTADPGSARRLSDDATIWLSSIILHVWKVWMQIINVLVMKLDIHFAPSSKSHALTYTRVHTHTHLN